MKKASRRFGFVVLVMSLLLLTVPASAQAETGTVAFYVVSCPATTVSQPGLYIADPVTGSQFPDGPLPGCVEATSTFDVEAADGTTISHDTVTGNLTLPVGLHTLTDQTSGLTAAANVASNGDTGVMLVLVDAESTATGTVSLSSQACPRSSAVFTSDAINGDGIPADEEWYAGCVDTSTTLSFLQAGETIAQVETAAGEVVLPEGQYLVVDQTTGAEATVNVVAGSPAAVYAQQHDGTPLAGDVYLRAETCPGREPGERLLVADPVLGGTLPEGPGAYDGCTPLAATFTFVNETGASTTVAVEEEVVRLPVGRYAVTEDTTGLTAEVNVVDTAPASVYLRITTAQPTTPPPTIAPTATPSGVTGLPATGDGTSAASSGMENLLLAGGVLIGLALVVGGGMVRRR